MPFTVKVIEPTGSETMMSGLIGSQAVTVLVRGRVDALPGTVLQLSPEEGHIHAFDAAGQRVDCWSEVGSAPAPAAARS